MEIPMQQQHNAIKEQYAQGQKTQTPEEQKLEQQKMMEKRDAQEKWLDENLPFIKKQEEYNRLKLSLLEMDGLMGNVPVRQIPGLLGLELMVREIQAQGYLADWAAGQEAAMKNKMNQPGGIQPEHVNQEAMAQMEAQSKEQWDALSQEEQEAITKDVEQEMKDKGIMDAYNALTEIQKINVIMQTAVMKKNAAAVNEPNQSE